jgi:hypothetical protein
MTDLYAAPLAEIRYDDLRDFVLSLEQADALTESAVLELKRERNGKNVVDAVAAMYNTDGGLVLVGVDEKGRGEARFVGVPAGTLDEIVNQLSALLDPRGLVPDIANVALPDGASVVTVVRVPPGSEHVPVLVAGKALVRLPGQSVPADRRALLELVGRAGRRGYGRTGQAAFDPANQLIWAGTTEPDVELRLWGHVVMAPSVAERFRFDTARQEAVVAALGSAPLTRLLSAPDMQDRPAPPRRKDGRPPRPPGPATRSGPSSSRPAAATPAAPDTRTPPAGFSCGRQGRRSTGSWPSAQARSSSTGTPASTAACPRNASPARPGTP